MHVLNQRVWKHIAGTSLWGMILVPALAFPQVLPFQYYTTKEGLPSNDILAICQDSRSVLWFGTAEGVSHYDGHAFTNLSLKDGLAFDAVNEIIEDQKSPGTMWFGTAGGGVSRYENGTFTTFHLGQTQEANTVTALMQDHNGSLWCGTDSGVFVLKDGGVREFHREIGFRAVTGIVELDDSLTWIAAQYGLYCYSQLSERLETIPLPRAKCHPEKMCKDSSGDLWVTTLEGDILQLRGGKITLIENTGLPEVPGYDTFYSLRDDGLGTLWAGTRSGLLKIRKNRISPEDITKYGAENGLPENTVNAFLIDREDNRWIGTLTRGLAKLSEKDIYRIPLHPIVTEAVNNAGGVTDLHGHLWLRSTKGVWEVWSDTQSKWHLFYHKMLDEHFPGVITGLALDSKGLVWMNVSEADIRAYRLEPGVNGESRLKLAKRVLLEKEFPGGIMAFILDRRGYIWASIISGVEGMLAVIDPSSSLPVKRIFRTVDGVPHSSIRALFEDRKGNIWFGGGYGGGLAMIAGGDWHRSITRRYTVEKGLSSDYVRVLGEDQGGRLLIGTRYGGLMILDGDSISTISNKDGLISNGIWGISTDSAGNILLGTHLGAQFFDATKHLPTETNSELIGGTVWSSGFLNHKDVWMVQQEAAVIYEFAHKQQRPLPPPVYINEVSVNGNAVPTEHLSELSNTENNILLRFVGISFRNERLNRYRYRLLDNDRTWHPMTQETSVNYAALKPGTYRFEVKAINADGVESVQPAVVSFTILAPFWLRWWFIALVNLLAIALIAIGYRYRLNQLLKLERMRTRIASDLHDDIGASLTRIALFSEVAREEAATSSPKLVEMAEKIGANARELLDSVGTLVWSIDPRHDRFEDVMTHMKNFAQEMLSMKGIEYTFTIQETLAGRQLPLESRKNILLIFKEAMNNIVKHSQCEHVSVSLGVVNGVFAMNITDDGQGLSSTTPRHGHGLMNMKNRATGIGGTLEVDSSRGQGVTILLKVPLAG